MIPQNSARSYYKYYIGLPRLHIERNLSVGGQYYFTLSHYWTIGISEVEIIKYPHPTLRHKSKPVIKIDKALKKMVEEMFALMYQADGVGLAANQVDLPYQLFVMNTSADPAKTEDEYVFINPVILKRRERAQDMEGCLSFPEINIPIIRPTEVEFEAITLNGEVQRLSFKGLLARAAQHEMDHLNGVCFIDRASPANLVSIREALEDLEMTFESNRERGFIPSDKEIRARLAELEKERT